jgi:hypothetical protein
VYGTEMVRVWLTRLVGWHLDLFQVLVQMDDPVLQIFRPVLNTVSWSYRTQPPRYQYLEWRQNIVGDDGGSIPVAKSRTLWGSGPIGAIWDFPPIVNLNKTCCRSNRSCSCWRLSIPNHYTSSQHTSSFGRGYSIQSEILEKEVTKTYCPVCIGDMFVHSPPHVRRY